MEADEWQLIGYLTENLSEVDFALSILAAATSSYRCESLMKPFPPMHILSNGDKDVSSLMEVIATLPSIRSIVDGKAILSSKECELLRWVIKSHRTRICSVGLDIMEDLRTLTQEHTPLPVPQRVYELKYDELKEAAFREKQADRNIIYAYHGSKPENFYSILHHGLHAHMNKTSLYGEGTYLAVEPTVAMGFSPWGVTGWPQSGLGSSLSIIALCEVIDHPSVVHNSAKGATRSTSARAPNSMGGNVPDKYLIVTNNDMLRVKYLLVYTRSSVPNRCPREGSRSMQWLHRNSQTLLVLLYVSILLFIGLMSSTRFWTRVQQLYEQTFDSWGRGNPL